MRFLVLHQSQNHVERDCLSAHLPIYNWVKYCVKMTDGVWAVQATPEVYGASGVFDRLADAGVGANVTVYPLTEDMAALFKSYDWQCMFPESSSGGQQTFFASDAGSSFREDKYARYFPDLNENDLADDQNIFGLIPQKQKLSSIINGIMYRKAAQNAGINVDLGFYNILLLGPAGVGKTTMAKFAAYKLRAAMGNRASAPIKIVKASDLIDRYRGGSTNNVHHLLESNRKAIIILDEIDALAAADNVYGKEVVDALNNDMGLYPNSPIIIGTGYPSSGEELLQTNIGLSSRFPNIINLPGYGQEDLVAIFTKLLDRAGYNYDRKILGEVEKLLVATRKRKGAHFGNAREANNIFHHIIDNVAQRISEMGLDIGILGAEKLAEGRGQLIRDLLRTIRFDDVPVLDGNGNYIRNPAVIESVSNPHEEDTVVPFNRAGKK